MQTSKRSAYHNIYLLFIFFYGYFIKFMQYKILVKLCIHYFLFKINRYKLASISKDFSHVCRIKRWDIVNCKIQMRLIVPERISEMYRAHLLPTDGVHQYHTSALLVYDKCEFLLLKSDADDTWNKNANWMG